MNTLRRKDSIFAILGAALLSAAASGLCCLGPLLYLVFGVSAAGLTGFARLGWLQLPMTVLSLLFVAYGFWRLYFSPRPVCAGRLSPGKIRLLYWLALPIILFFILYPWILPLFFEE